MTPVEFNLILFLLAVCAFAWIGFSASRKETSAHDYFHHDDLRKNVVSLTATNITLGTGLVYLISGAQQNGLLMLLPVLCVGVGYWLLAVFLERVTLVSLRTGKNFLASIDSQITQTTGRPSWFAKTASGSLVFVFTLLLAFEIFASAKVISPFLFRTPTVQAEAIISISIFCITVLYSLLGGVRAMFGVDVIQVPLICLFLPAFFFTAIPDLNQPSVVLSRLVSTLKTDPNVLMAVAIACINSVATQFYSILNWGAVSNVELAHQQKLLKRVGWLTAGVLVVFVLIGLLHPPGASGNTWQDLIQHYSELSSQTTVKAFALSAIIMLGMASILLTTTDAVVVNCILFWYDNLAGGDSKAKESNRAQLRKIRLIGLVTFSACFGVLMCINYFQPDPFYLLLSMAGGVVVFAPMIVTAGYLASRGDSLRLFTPKIVSLYVALFMASGVADVVLLSRKSPLVAYVGFAAFVAASLISLSVILLSRRATVSQARTNS